VQKELADLKAKYETDTKELSDIKAKDETTKNAAFRQKFEGERTALFESAKETVAAAKLTLDDEKLNTVFSAANEYEMRKALDALAIQDPTAVAVLSEKAKGYIALTKEMDGLLNGKSGKTPSEVAAEWKAYEAQLGGAMTQKFTAALQGQTLEAVGEKHSFFKTDAGKLVLDEMETRFRQGWDVPIPEVVEAMALGRTAPIWEKMATENAAKVRVLEEQIRQLKGQGPGSIGDGGHEGAKKLNSDGSGSDPFGSRGSDIVLPVGGGNRMAASLT
jgi:hypothetical protein